jgi:two-component system sensor histidine kinase YesM
MNNMKNIMNTASPDEFHGYGIKNINEKLSLLYGKGYGLTFRSRPLGGTLVTIMIPVTS